MKYILVPTSMPDKITLYEALMWAGFNMYFLAEYSEKNIESRQDIEFSDYSSVVESPDEIDSFFTEEVCHKYGLPKSYLAEYINANNYYPYNPNYSWENIREFEEKETFNKEYLEELKNDKKIAEAIEQKQKPFDAALEDYLEIIKSELFIALKKGNIKSFGREVLASLIEKEDYESDELKNIYSLTPKDWFGSHEEDTDLLPIPKKDFIQNNIDWKSSILTNQTKCYCHILVDIESLFNFFPEPTPEVVNTYSVNGTLLIDKNKPLVNRHIKTGRPSYKWKDFTEEMTRRFASETLPDLQKTCVIEMSEWCEDNWGITPSETNLKEHISPFYKIKKEVKQKSESNNEKTLATF